MFYRVNAQLISFQMKFQTTQKQKIIRTRFKIWFHWGFNVCLPKQIAKVFPYFSQYLPHLLPHFTRTTLFQHDYQFICPTQMFKVFPYYKP